VHVNLQPHLQFQLQLIVVVAVVAIIFMANACQMQLNECGLPTTTRSPAINSTAPTAIATVTQAFS